MLFLFWKSETLFFFHRIRMFLASLSPSAVMIELRFERMKQAHSVPQSGDVRRHSVFLRTSTTIRALWRNDSKHILLRSSSNRPILVASSIGLTMTVEALDVLANAYWNSKNEAAISFTKEHTHTSHCSLGLAEVPPRVSARPDEFPPGISTLEPIRGNC